MDTTPVKHCLACHKPFTGRSDKKFCDDYCRSAHNNRLKSTHNNYIRNVNSALLRNRRILENLLPPTHEKVKVHEEHLRHHGFQFHYHTHSYTTKKGQHYLFCYEYGYLAVGNNWFLIVRRTGQSFG